MKKIYYHQGVFSLEQGDSISALEITYHIYGESDNSKPVLWICHALTASSDVADWWLGLVGEGKCLDPAHYLIICANILGSCYGSTGPSSLDAAGKPLGHRFPQLTIRDMAAAHQALADHLEISRIHLIIGGSMGGYQALEWSLMQRIKIEKMILLATSAAESTWGKAIHASQRMAIEADPHWTLGIKGKGDSGLKAARAIGMLSYRNPALLHQQQQDEDPNQLGDYKVASYLVYQAEKLSQRFDACSYHRLTLAMDSHNIARNRSSDIASVLNQIQSKTLVIGIKSDILCPVDEQAFLAEHISNASLEIIDSPYGHDGFLIEHETIGKIIGHWLQT